MLVSPNEILACPNCGSQDRPTFRIEKQRSYIVYGDESLTVRPKAIDLEVDALVCLACGKTAETLNRAN